MMVFGQVTLLHVDVAHPHVAACLVAVAVAHAAPVLAVLHHEVAALVASVHEFVELVVHVVLAAAVHEAAALGRVTVAVHVPADREAYAAPASVPAPAFAAVVVAAAAVEALLD